MQTISVHIQVSEPAVKDEFKKQIVLTEGFSVVDSRQPCDLLILEIGHDFQKDLQYVSRAVATGEAGSVYLTAKDVEPDMLIGAMRAGVREFFPQPVKHDEVQAALIRLRKEIVIEEPSLLERRVGKVFSVFGTKGGVGTTTIAVNLATGLARLDGKPKVAVVDMNLLFGEVPIFLNMKPLFDWGEVTRNVARMDTTYLSSILVSHQSGVTVLPSPAKAIEECQVTPEVIETLLRLMCTMFDYIVVDGGQSLGNISRHIISISDKLILVSIPSLPGVINLKRVLETLENLDYPGDDIAVVINRYNQKSGIPISETQKAINRDIKWTVPNDYRNTMSAINHGEPLTIGALNADITRKILDIASHVAGREDVKKKERRRFFG